MKKRSKTGILVELTTQQEKSKNKINKFCENAKIFLELTNPLRDKLSSFQSITDIDLEDLDEIENWKLLYLSNSKDLLKKNYLPRDFTTRHNIFRDKLFILNTSYLEYFNQLYEVINKYSRYEFLSFLNFHPSELGDTRSLLEKDFLKVSNKYINEKKDDVKADIYLAHFKVEELLKIVKVSRYEGLPFGYEQDNKNYQRFLIKKKIEEISKNFIDNNPKKLFPATITLVMSETCVENEEKNKLLIPYKYSIIDIIDGQHRLFAYTNTSISDETREQAEILTTLIKFKENSNFSKSSAKIFCEINSKQAKVSKNLLYSIKYDTIGDRDFISIGGKILKECNKSGKFPLGNLFAINPLMKKNVFGLQPIPLVTIIESDLIQFLKGEGLSKVVSETKFSEIFGNTKTYYLANTDQFWKKAKEILEKYFHSIVTVFDNDWKENSESLFLSAKYISAVIRLLRNYLFDDEKSLDEIENYLSLIKNNIVKKINVAPNETILKSGNINIPPTKLGIATIYNFLKEPNSYTS